MGTDIEQGFYAPDRLLAAVKIPVSKGPLKALLTAIIIVICGVMIAYEADVSYAIFNVLPEPQPFDVATRPNQDFFLGALIINAIPLGFLVVSFFMAEPRKHYIRLVVVLLWSCLAMFGCVSRANQVCDSMVAARVITAEQPCHYDPLNIGISHSQL